MEKEIKNKVAESGIITIMPEEYIVDGLRSEIDIKDQLFRGLILREQDFRDFIKNHNWEQYRGHYVHIHCSTDAIVPTWAYMLIAKELEGIAADIYYGSRISMESELIRKEISKRLEEETYRDKRVVIKGCGDKDVSIAAYIEITKKLKPHVKSIMYGEPCSTVPVYKRPLRR